MAVYGPSPENDGSFVLSLSMAAPHCPSCGEASEPGECGVCGVEVPPTEEVTESASIRSRALADLVRRAAALYQSFEVNPAVGPTVTDDQFAGSIEQASVLSLLDDAELACQRLSAFDFDDQAVVAGPLREAIANELGLMEEVRDICVELGALVVPEAALRAREELLGAGQRAAEMMLRFLETVTAHSITEVREGETELQLAIRRGSRCRELPERVADLCARFDIDGRIALLTGRAGSYLDEAGFVDLGRVFGAYAGEEGAYERMAESAYSYFRHLLPEEPGAEGGAILLLPAVTLSSLDRPLLAHRCAREMSELVLAAARLDPGAVGTVLEESMQEGPRLFAAASRIQKGLRLLSRVAEWEGIDEELLLREVMTGYLEIAESSFRSHGWAVLKMQAIVEGDDAGGAGPPTVGSLEQRLRASKSGLAGALGEAADPELRNAVGHSQYRWDANAGEVEDLKTGKRWDVETLADSVEALGDSVVGIDAGYVCGIVASRIEIEALCIEPDPWITAILAEAAFAVAGYELVGVSPDGATVEIRPTSEGDVPSLMAALASQSVLAGKAEAYRVLDADSGQVLLDVPGERMLAATKGPAVTRDLEIIQCFSDSASRTGAQVSTATGAGLALQAKIVAVNALYALAVDGSGSSVAEKIRTRAEAVRSFAKGDAEAETAPSRAVTKRLERLIADSYRLEREEDKALKSVLRRLRSLFAWAEEQGVSWPPAVGA